MDLAEAMALLELGSVDHLTRDELQAVARRAKKRWHPDNVSWRNDAAETARYTRAFQAIEEAVETVAAFLGGAYAAGRRAAGAAQRAARETVENIRERAAEMQRALVALWAEAQRRKYQWTSERVVVAEGRPLGEMLKEDFDDDLTTPACVAWFFGYFPLFIVAAVLHGIHPALGAVGLLALFAYVMVCWIGMMPLARYWLPEQVQPIILGNLEFGARIFRWSHRRMPDGASLLLFVPLINAWIFRNFIIRPIAFVVTTGWGRRVIGRVERDVDYYAGLADWYVGQLLAKLPADMTGEELLHLAHFHDAMRDMPPE